MLEPERETMRTLGGNPGLFVGGFAVAGAWLVAQVVAAAPVMLVTLPRNTQPVFALPLASLVSVVVLPPALAGLYATTREARTEEGLELRASLVAFPRGCLEHARSLLVATATFRVVALLPAAAVLVALLAGDTAVTYLGYAAGGIERASGLEDLVFVWLYAMVAGAVGRLALAFYDLPVLFAGVSPRRGWRAALRFTRRRPRTVLRYGVVRFLLWAPMLAVLALQAGVLVGDTSDPLADLALFGGASLLVGTVTSSSLAAHHVVVYERAVEPVLREPTPAGDRDVDGSALTEPGEGTVTTVGAGRRGTVAVVVGLLVVAAAVGTGAVRVSDARPMPEAASRVDGEATGEEVVRTAEATVAAASYRSRARSYRVNGTTGERHLLIETRVAVDRRDRRARLRGRVRADADDWLETSVYASEGTLAMDMPGDEPPTGDVPLRERFVGRTAGPWAVMYLPGYGTLSGVPPDPLVDAGDGDWRVVERSDAEVVVGYREEPDGEAPDDGEAVGEERVRLTVDRGTGRPTRLVRNRTHVEYENGSAVGRYWTVEETTYEYGDPDVRRPDAIGPRGPVEWLWDLVYY